ncbi:OadG family protein [Fusibacter ferrireducens]|uniref:OadG family protein n=1 Tax=Fusibacter ferrireducens TaxID=2785058 RepID=A0ABR9ZYR8_9FIRM|nr:OadG family protein [Fusibacter ferrireducens]MBF4695600.1 OadG family protein [Fusibacter ferrireducens]
MQILENFKHAETFAQMTLGDKMMATLYVILLGMGITFVALILIWALTALMSRIIRAVEGGSKPAVTEAVAPKAPAQTTVNEEEDEALIAVITAAIAASLNTSMHNIIVTNITRINDETPVWGRAGRSDVMNSRF